MPCCDAGLALLSPLNQNLFDMELLENIKIVGVAGLGLLGSSVAHACKKYGKYEKVVGFDSNNDFCAKACEIGFVDEAADEPEILSQVDLLVLCVPVGAFEAVAKLIMPHLKEGCLITDVASTKGSVVKDVEPLLTETIEFVPAHPISGSEKAGPTAGWAELFEERWVVITPTENTGLKALETVRQFWENFGARIEIMEVERHDQILAMTSHLPHLIAYTLVGTAVELEKDMKDKVIEYSAGGFRDFTRIAASRPELWRDIFLNNKEALLDMLQRFSEDLSILQKAIRRDNADILVEHFTKTKPVHAEIVKANQQWEYKNRK